MWSFLSELTRRPSEARTVVVLDEEGAEPPHRYRVRAVQVLALWGGSLAAAAVLAAVLVSLTPLRALMPGYSAAEMQEGIRVNAVRVAALEDSLAVAGRYREQLQRLITGRIDSAAAAAAGAPAPAPAAPPAAAEADDASGGAVTGELAEVAVDPWSADWNDHAQPAVSLLRVPAGSVATAPPPLRPSLASLQFPVMPPVDGFITRGFGARAGHYAVDLAVEEGTPVRSIGDGYVIMADWTQSGGYALAVQHAGGYVSIYKHNRRLLKRVGDRVRAREVIALSGNTGEITTGPHVHVELWRGGLAQDPVPYFAW